MKDFARVMVVVGFLLVLVGIVGGMFGLSPDVIAINIGIGASAFLASIAASLLK